MVSEFHQFSSRGGHVSTFIVLLRILALIPVTLSARPARSPVYQ
jgi:hypothetical protein